MVREDRQRAVPDLVQMFEAENFRVGLQELVGQDVVDPLHERIGRVVAPADVGPEPRLHREKRVGSGQVQLAIERDTNVLEREELLIGEERQDRGDERVARRDHGSLNLRPPPSRV